MRPGEIEDYLDGIVARLTTLGGTFSEPPQILLDPTRVRGILQLRQSFPDQSMLSVRILAVGPAHFPDWLDYRFHLMDARGRCIFRYDNAPHHPGGSHYPHHKHHGPAEIVSDEPRPSVAQVVREVAEHLRQASQ